MAQLLADAKLALAGRLVAARGYPGFLAQRVTEWPDLPVPHDHNKAESLDRGN
jgi:hypothetical protein